MMHGGEAAPVAQDPAFIAKVKAELARRQGGQDPMTASRMNGLAKEGGVPPQGGEADRTYGLQAQSEKMQAVVPILSELDAAFHGHPALMSAFANLVKALQKTEKDGSF